MAADLELIRSEVSSRLPLRTRWLIAGTPLEFDFSRSQRPLKKVYPSDLNGCDIDKEWTALYLFGEENFAEGGGARPWLGVHKDTGEIFGLDIERESSVMFFLNSNITRFVETFRVFNDAIDLGTVAYTAMASVARGIDPLSFDRSEWRVLAGRLSNEDERV